LSENLASIATYATTKFHSEKPYHSLLTHLSSPKICLNISPSIAFF